MLLYCQVYSKFQDNIATDKHIHSHMCMCVCVCECIRGSMINATKSNKLSRIFI